MSRGLQTLWVSAISRRVAHVGLALAFVVSATGASTASAEEGRFDLVCSGTLQTLIPELRKDESKPYTETYRVDLDNGKWCSGDCKVQFDFASITPVAIFFENKNIDTPRQRNIRDNLISRETGKHIASSQNSGSGVSLSMFWKGQCEKQDFSGFPAVETKF